MTKEAKTPIKDNNKCSKCGRRLTIPLGSGEPCCNGHFEEEKFPICEDDMWNHEIWSLYHQNKVLRNENQKLKDKVKRLLKAFHKAIDSLKGIVPDEF